LRHVDIQHITHVEYQQDRDPMSASEKRAWLMRLLAVGRRGRRDEEFQEEMRFHVEELARALEQRGFDRGAARIAAECELGGMNRTEQAWRDQRSWLPLEEEVQDIPYGGRVVGRSGGLSVIGALVAPVCPGRHPS